MSSSTLVPVYHSIGRVQGFHFIYQLRDVLLQQYTVYCLPQLYTVYRRLFVIRIIILLKLQILIKKSCHG